MPPLHSSVGEEARAVYLLQKGSTRRCDVTQPSQGSQLGLEPTHPTSTILQSQGKLPALWGWSGFRNSGGHGLWVKSQDCSC